MTRIPPQRQGSPIRTTFDWHASKGERAFSVGQLLDSLRALPNKNQQQLILMVLLHVLEEKDLYSRTTQITVEDLRPFSKRVITANDIADNLQSVAGALVLSIKGREMPDASIEELFYDLRPTTQYLGDYEHVVKGWLLSIRPQLN